MAPNSLKRKLLAFDTRTKKAPAKKAQRKRSSTTTATKVKREAKLKPDPGLATIPNAPLKPKVEYSPNSMARCQGCRKKIQKEHKRFGIPEYCARYEKEIYRYYHVRCCPNRYQAMVPDAAAQLAQQKQLVKNKEAIVQQRQGLFKDLKKLRLLFANRLEVGLVQVFNNQVLQELVVHMPTTSAQLLEVHGIGPTKLRSFGDPILSLIRQYKQQMKEASVEQKNPKVKSEALRKAGRKKAPPSVAAAAPEVIAIHCDDDDDEIVMGASLTCEQLVQQKFDHAASNGYVIAVD